MSNIHLLEKHLEGLPDYIKEFVQYKTSKSSENTLIEYVRDFNLFFEWLCSEGYHDGEIKDVPLMVLEKLKIRDISFFEAHCKMKRKNLKDTIARRIMSLKSLFHYLSQIAEDDDYYPYLKRNVMAKIEVTHEKYTESEKTRRISSKILINDEIEEFREFVIRGYYELVKDNTRELNYYLKNKERDYAIISLILGSGIRVSEVVSLDMNKVDWNKHQLTVKRKGDKYDSVAFSDSAYEALKKYFDIRSDRYSPDGNEKAMFLSLPSKTGTTNRFSKISAQKMVKKYAEAFGKSDLSVHKLRHTFATRHFQANKDIRSLQTQLAHGSMNTTAIYTHVFDDTLIDSVNNAEKHDE